MHIAVHSLRIATHQEMAMQLWAEHAWLPSGWQDSVLLQVEDDHWNLVQSGVAAPEGVTILPGPVLPGMINAHSHAFQRAFAGLAEYRTAARDDFWTWRDRMYRVAMRVDPALMRLIATQLFSELLLGGYTHLCEFHYLHHRADGTRYDDPHAMAWSLMEAAEEAGIGMTLIPVIYERAGFDSPLLRDDQRPFAMNAFQTWQAFEDIRLRESRLVTASFGAHSLRAARPDSIRELHRLAEGWDGPIHIHVAEQTGEVEACIDSTGMRPLEWLASEKLLDRRWHLVHTTHTVSSELDALAKTGARVVLCPNTEGNLGDGLCDAMGFLERGIGFAIGSDSQITRAWTEELRMLEYAQRLKLRQRCVTANPDRNQNATGERLFSLALENGASAAGFEKWGFTPGARADLLVMDLADPALVGIPREHWLDAAIFSSPCKPWRDVMAGGRWLVKAHQHIALPSTRTQFETAMKSIWNSK